MNKFHWYEVILFDVKYLKQGHLHVITFIGGTYSSLIH